jgi:hypothetical protein
LHYQFLLLRAAAQKAHTAPNITAVLITGISAGIINFPAEQNKNLLPIGIGILRSLCVKRNQQYKKIR